MDNHDFSKYVAMNNSSKKNTMLVNVSVQTMLICWNAFLEKSNLTAIAQQQIDAIVAVIVFLVICLLNVLTHIQQQFAWDIS